MNNLFQVDENSIEQCFAVSIVSGCIIVTIDSGSTMLFNIVNILEQCWQRNNVQCCFYQPAKSCSFWLIFGCVPVTRLYELAGCAM